MMCYYVFSLLLILPGEQLLVGKICKLNAGYYGNLFFLKYLDLFVLLGKMLLVRIVENNKLMSIIRQVRLSKV